MNYNQINNRIPASNKNSKDDSNQFILPRQGWQDKRAFLKAIIKAKRALDIAEINNLLN